MRFSHRLCEAKFGSAPIAIATARNQIPHRNSAALPRARRTPARPSTISAAAA